MGLNEAVRVLLNAHKEASRMDPKERSEIDSVVAHMGRNRLELLVELTSKEQ